MSVAPTFPAQHPDLQPRNAWSEQPDVLTFVDVPELSEPEAPQVPSDLSAMSTRELRVLCNRLYRVLDSDFPPFGAREDYAEVVEILEERAARALRRPEEDGLRETFRDNPAGSRFELFLDGTMVGYLRYHLRAGRIHLIETVAGPAHRDSGLEAVLAKESLLSAHRRRLAPVPYCGYVQAFLAENPQYRALVPSL